MTPSYLFLHMGPGLHSAVERNLLGPDSPQIDFWDQPQNLDNKNAFRDLVAATKQKVAQLYNESGKPIHIIAHSFGGHIATHVLTTNGHMIESCKFISTGFDIGRGFRNLLRLLCANATGNLYGKSTAFLTAHKGRLSIEQFWEMVGLIVSFPDFMRLYWPSENSYKAYGSHLAQTPALDFQVFSNVLNDFLVNYFGRPIALTWPGPITFEIGDRDPLILVDQEIADWKALYPRARFNVRNGSGHFVHLEDKIAKLK